MDLPEPPPAAFVHAGHAPFAVRDARRRILFCARDHVGARPFYHARTPHGFAFASTVEAVLAVPGVGDGLDERHRWRPS